MGSIFWAAAFRKLGRSFFLWALSMSRLYWWGPWYTLALDLEATQCIQVLGMEVSPRTVATELSYIQSQELADDSRFLRRVCEQVDLLNMRK